MTILNLVIVILGLIALFVYVGLIVITCIERWKICCDEKIKRNFVESFAKVAALAVIIIICVLIYFHICNT